MNSGYFKELCVCLSFWLVDKDIRYCHQSCYYSVHVSHFVQEVFCEWRQQGWIFSTFTYDLISCLQLRKGFHSYFLSFTHTHTHISLCLPQGERGVQIFMRQYLGEITTGLQVSSFHPIISIDLRHSHSSITSPYPSSHPSFPPSHSSMPLLHAITLHTPLFHPFTTTLHPSCPTSSGMTSLPFYQGQASVSMHSLI